MNIFLAVNKRNKNLVDNLQEINLLTEDFQKFVTAESKEPVVFSAEKDTEVSLCGCKESNNAPYCSGAHANI